MPSQRARTPLTRTPAAPPSPRSRKKTSRPHPQTYFGTRRDSPTQPRQPSRSMTRSRRRRAVRCAAARQLMRARARAHGSLDVAHHSLSTSATTLQISIFKLPACWDRCCKIKQRCCSAEERPPPMPCRRRPRVSSLTSQMARSAFSAPSCLSAEALRGARARARIHSLAQHTHLPRRTTTLQTLRAPRPPQSLNCMSGTNGRIVAAGARPAAFSDDHFSSGGARVQRQVSKMGSGQICG